MKFLINGVPHTCVFGAQSIRMSPRANGNNNGNGDCPCGRCTCKPDECRPCPEPELFPYVVAYYAGSIAPENFLGIVNGSGQVGDFINADLTLFAPPGYEVPGIRSGAEFISAIPADNVVNVVYQQLVIGD